jgi:hypothetical protein
MAHYPTLPNGNSDPTWGQYSNQAERPAAPEDDVGESTGNFRMFSEQYAMIFCTDASGRYECSTASERAEY